MQKHENPGQVVLQSSYVSSHGQNPSCFVGVGDENEVVPRAVRVCLEHRRLRSTASWMMFEGVIDPDKRMSEHVKDVNRDEKCSRRYTPGDSLV
jgi:hypothetical protein